MGDQHVANMESGQSESAGRTGQSRKRGTETDFTLLHRDNESPYTDERPLLVAGKPELREGLASRLREDKCVYGLNDEEIGLFSDEVLVNCAP